MCVVYCMYVIFTAPYPTLQPSHRRCKRYISAHWSPTGRWLRKHVQERDSQRGVEGLFQEESPVPGCREPSHTQAHPPPDPDSITFIERLTWLCTVSNAYRPSWRVRASSHTYARSHTLLCLHLNPSALTDCAETKSSTQMQSPPAKK